jgi:hypothetical protein
MTQSEVRDPALSPIARAAANARPHEPARSDWAAEVDEALGLSPAVPSNSTTPTPVNPVPSDATVDPGPTTFAKAVPADPIPVDPAPVSPVNPIRTAFANPMPSNSTTTPSVHPDPISTHPARVCAQPVDPDPSDVVTNPTGAVPAKTNTAPIKPDCPLPKPTAAPLSGDMAPCAVQTHTPAMGTLTALTTINPVRTAPTSAITVDPNPARVALGNTVPINPIPDEPDPESTTLVNPTDPICIVFASTSPTQPIHVDTVPVHTPCSKLTPVDPFIKSLPADSVPVDPIRITPVEPVFAFITLSGIKHIRHTVKNHLYFSLTHVQVFAVF